jgi:type III pantothenate kinase
MNLAIDVGNTRTKVGIFEGASMKEKKVFQAHEDVAAFIGRLDIENIILSSVTREDHVLESTRIRGKFLTLTPTVPLPIQNHYATPATLGVDRLAAACGAWTLFPGEASLVIDMGTCINYEYVNESGKYLGGAISPGVTMRYRAMHEFTGRLPLGEPGNEVPLTGSTTISCLQSGVMNGIAEEINGLTSRYRKANPHIRVILTGGDSQFFEKLMNPAIFVAPDLVLVGLNSILLHNVTP